jgi:hypothetical protein
MYVCWYCMYAGICVGTSQATATVEYQTIRTAEVVSSPVNIVNMVIRLVMYNHGCLI